VTDALHRAATRPHCAGGESASLAELLTQVYASASGWPLLPPEPLRSMSSSVRA
jgi:hypothetical protein